MQVLITLYFFFFISPWGKKENKHEEFPFSRLKFIFSELFVKVIALYLKADISFLIFRIALRHSDSMKNKNKKTLKLGLR